MTIIGNHNKTAEQLARQWEWAEKTADLIRDYIPKSHTAKSALK